MRSPFLKRPQCGKLVLLETSKGKGCRMRSRARVSLFAALMFTLPCGRTLGGGPPEMKPPLPPKPQPIPFSHKVHAKVVTGCQYCHEPSNSGMDMSFPAATKCMVCHSSIAGKSRAIVNLAKFQRENQPIPWVQVYTVPDYVLFSHSVHAQTKIPCEACHARVAERDVTVKERPTSMKFCVDCHTRMHAPVACNTCHNPNP